MNVQTVNFTFFRPCAVSGLNGLFYNKHITNLRFVLRDSPKDIIIGNHIKKLFLRVQTSGLPDFCDDCVLLIFALFSNLIQGSITEFSLSAYRKPLDYTSLTKILQKMKLLTKLDVPVLPKSGDAVFYEYLTKNTTIKTLKFENSLEIEDKYVIEMISNSLKENTTVSKLILENFTINDASSAYLENFIKKNINLKFIQQAFVGNSFLNLCQWLAPSNLTSFYASGKERISEDTDEIVRLLGIFLRKNTLKKFGIWHIITTEKLTTSILAALADNTSLEKFTWDGPLSKQDAFILRDILTKNTVLKSLNLASGVFLPQNIMSIIKNGLEQNNTLEKIVVCAEVRFDFLWDLLPRNILKTIRIVSPYVNELTLPDLEKLYSNYSLTECPLYSRSGTDSTVIGINLQINRGVKFATFF